MGLPHHAASVYGWDDEHRDDCECPECGPMDDATRQQILAEQERAHQAAAEFDRDEAIREVIGEPRPEPQIDEF